MNSILSLPLPSLCTLAVQGPDAEAFLQGQISNDVRLLSPTRGLLAAYNSPKGRMLAVLQLLRQEAEIRIELHESVAEATLKRLRMFVLRSRVTVEDASARSAVWGLLGDGAPAVLAQQGLPAPAAPQECATADGLLVLRRLGELPRYTVHGPAERLRERFGALPAGTAADWTRADIRCGLPVVYAQTREMFVPQMANLDLLGGISFNKGCYTGQEIVARLHFLGQLKRRLFVLRSPVPLAPGAPLYAADGAGQSVGEVVDCAPDGDTFLLSAVLQLTHVGSRLLADSAGGPALSLEKSFLPEGASAPPSN